MVRGLGTSANRILGSNLTLTNERVINEELYKSDSKTAVKMMREDPSIFEAVRVQSPDVRTDNTHSSTTSVSAIKSYPGPKIPSTILSPNYRLTRSKL